MGKFAPGLLGSGANFCDYISPFFWLKGLCMGEDKCREDAGAEPAEKLPAYEKVRVI